MLFKRAKSVPPAVHASAAESVADAIDIAPLLDAFGQVLSSYGRGGFDLPGRPAADIAAEIERWRMHAVLGTPLEGGDQHQSARSRDFRGAATMFSEHRRTEKRLVESALTDLRDCLWTCVQRVHVAVQADVDADSASATQIARVQRAIHSVETGAVKDEVLQAIAALEKISMVRREKQQSSYSELASRIEQLAAQLEEARRESETDSLTALGNRKRFEHAAERALQIHSISRAPVTLVLMDLDGMKAINDSLGHQAGDTALKEFATALSKVFLRDADVQCRVGGDEFAVLLPNTGRQLAERLTDRLVSTVAAMTLWGEAGPRLGVSVGYAEAELGEDVAAWTARVDAALYRAKGDGRGRAEAA